MWLRLLLALIFLCLGLKALVYLARQLSPKRPRPKVEEWNAAQGANEMVRDPVCGLYIPAQEAVSLVRAGKAVHFCSDECRQRFMKSYR